MKRDGNLEVDRGLSESDDLGGKGDTAEKEKCEQRWKLELG